MSAWFYTSKPSNSMQRWLSTVANCEECDVRVSKQNLRVLNNHQVCQHCYKEMKKEVVYA